MSQIDRYKQRQRTKKLRELSKSFSGGAGVRENIRAAREAVRTLQIQTGMSTEEAARKLVQTRIQIQAGQERLGALYKSSSSPYRPGRTPMPPKTLPRARARSEEETISRIRSPSGTARGGHLSREIAEYVVRGKRR